MTPPSAFHEEELSENKKRAAEQDYYIILEAQSSFWLLGDWVDRFVVCIHLGMKRRPVRSLRDGQHNRSYERLCFFFVWIYFKLI
jgi:hypothetical protein